jgi:hypothetical protein
MNIKKVLLKHNSLAVLVLLFFMGIFVVPLYAVNLPEIIQCPDFPLIQTPAVFQAKRQTLVRHISEGEQLTVFQAKGPGCIKHFWLTADCIGEGLRIKIYADSDTAQVDMNLNHFFGILLDKLPYRVETPGVKVLPYNAYNCYLPIPFSKSCKIVIEVDKFSGGIVWKPEAHFERKNLKNATFYFQANWQKYESDKFLSPYRLHALFHQEKPAKKNGIFELADISGKGFIASMFKGITHKDKSDRIYHTGGSTWLIDGESRPNAFRGFNEEDDFNYSWGYFPYQSHWCGCVYVDEPGPDTSEFVAWRFFGPDPVPFESSIIINFGCRADNTAAVLHYYKILDSDAGEINTPKQWQLTGPFDASTFEKFNGIEVVESMQDWSEKVSGKPLRTLASRHGWIDARQTYRNLFHLWKDYAAKVVKEDKNAIYADRWPLGMSFYARGKVSVQKNGIYDLRLGFDDWMKIWINGEEVTTIRHDNGFDVAVVKVKLNEGENEIMIKLNNNSNREYRLFAFNCAVKKT